MASPSVLSYLFGSTPAGAVTGRALRDDALRGELGYLSLPGGGHATELSSTVNDPRLFGGRPTNIPLLVKGQVGLPQMLGNLDRPPSDQQYEIAILRALQRLQQGARLPSYDTMEEALRAAESRPVSAKIPYRR
jgi:hypothetical protein